MLIFFRTLFFLLSGVRFTIYLPLPGLGCGVLGLIFKKIEVDMGKIAASLLRSLEYRGYDSTGAAIQGNTEKVILRKDVGAPSELVKTLGIEDMEGRLFCGQVRWATFGAVTRDNSQPHEVFCKRHIYGAHNGNITNTTFLKEYLLQEGHTVVSDNDGEMLVHMIEHYFDLELVKVHEKKADNPDVRKRAMRRAIIEAGPKLEGSYAAVITDPVSKTMWAIKGGSSLYVGKGSYHNNPFILASSDLTAILKFTKNLIQLNEGEFVEYNSENYQVISQKDHKVTQKDKSVVFYKAGDVIQVPLKRSKLRVEDTALSSPFNFYMEQEIYASINSTYKLIGFFNEGTPTNKLIAEELWRHRHMGPLEKLALQIAGQVNFDSATQQFTEFAHSEQLKRIKKILHAKKPDLKLQLFNPDFMQKEFNSKYASVFLDLYENTNHGHDTYDFLLASKIMDTALEQREIRKFKNYVQQFVETIVMAWEGHCNIYTVSAGTSFNACKTAALFFNEIAGIEIIPILPGNFRGQYSSALRHHDVLIGVSQSGETKDLIDIFNEVEAKNLKISKIAIVNNENSSLAQEKSDYYLPIKCGPEIAVPATKSYLNQVVLFYYLAIRAAEFKADVLKKKQGPSLEQKKLMKAARKRFKAMSEIPELLAVTIRNTRDQIEMMADELFLEPSIHILATRISSVAEEAALKIRETVLNHAQGIEGSEFKHGPNTILGTNTILGLREIEDLLRKQTAVVTKILEMGQKPGIRSEELRYMIASLGDFLFHGSAPFNLSPASQKIFDECISDYHLVEYLNRNYPLIYITGPDERDVKLTISQINTHKIRGANTYVIAEENPALKENASRTPEKHPHYRWMYITLPKTGDTLLATFSSIIVTQLLALDMSVKKMKFLNKLKVPVHGVHPDVPKNVSKSITVD